MKKYRCKVCKTEAIDCPQIGAYCPNPDCEITDSHMEELNGD